MIICNERSILTRLYLKQTNSINFLCKLKIYYNVSLKILESKKELFFFTTIRTESGRLLLL